MRRNNRWVCSVGNCWTKQWWAGRRSLEAGRRLHWEAMRQDWDGLDRYWPWPMERRGSGVWSRDPTGPTRTNCWTSIMPAGLSVDGGGSLASKGPSRPAPMGGKPTTPVATRKRETGAAAPCRLAAPWRGHCGVRWIRREQNYFSVHARRTDLQTLADRGWPSIAAVNRRIGLPPTAVSGRKRPEPVLDSRRSASPRCFRRRRDDGHWAQLWLTA